MQAKRVDGSRHAPGNDRANHLGDADHKQEHAVAGQRPRPEVVVDHRRVEIDAVMKREVEEKGGNHFSLYSRLATTRGTPDRERTL